MIYQIALAMFGSYLGVLSVNSLKIEAFLGKLKKSALIKFTQL
jgi:hypothetical protein